MIISYGGKNCWSFKDWFEINLRINKNVPREYGFSTKPIVPIMCFEGPNASGKTSALRVLSFIADFCKNSFSYDTESETPFDTYYHNQDESEFFVSFSLPQDMETEYNYEVKFLDKKVISEKLSFAKGKNKTIISRKKDKIVQVNLPDLKSFDNSIRLNASFISTLNQYGIKSIEPFIGFFKSIISNISYIGRQEDNSLSDPAAYYHEHPEQLKRVVNELKKLDTGIGDIEIAEFTNQENRKIYYSIIYNETEEGRKPLNHWLMSTGSKALYFRLCMIFDTLDRGGVLLFDEIDSHLHSSLVPKILGLFLDNEVNKNNAQLIFTSHDSSLLDLMKKYRTYIFEKEKGESICYRIDELPSAMTSRNDRSLNEVYKSGIIGGIPDV